MFVSVTPTDDSGTVYDHVSFNTIHILSIRAGQKGGSTLELTTGKYVQIKETVKDITIRLNRLSRDTIGF